MPYEIFNNNIKRELGQGNNGANIKTEGIVQGFSGSRVGGYPYAGESGNKYYKYFPREERREEREGRGEDQARREARRGERDEKRESRVREREERKAGREHDKEKKARFDSPIIVEELPTGEITHLYLDGNNMMFVASCLRNMTLHRQQRKVESLFTRLAILFAEATEKDISHTTLVFDNTPAKLQRQLRNSRGSFELCSARPNYTTSDDAIVDWLSKIKNSPGVKLCVTSDRGLIERIEQEGGIVMKPKKWMLLAASTLNKSQVTNLDDWMEKWCDLQTDL